jgi:DNA end-binding protein Ku
VVTASHDIAVIGVTPLSPSSGNTATVDVLLAGGVRVMRAIWKGTISFGLVAIPVRLYAATESKNVAFHQVHGADGGRVRYKRVCSVDGEEVPYDQIAKGYELADGQMVILTDADLADLPLSSSRSIDVLAFLPLEAIDPIYFDRSYYLEPEQAAIKPYLLLRDALHRSGRVAVVKITLRHREAPAVLRVHAGVLVLVTMLWPDEVRVPEFAFLAGGEQQVRDQELAMAGTLIESLADDEFDPGQYHDTYREALTVLIDAKIAGREMVTPAPAGTEPMDLMAALRASVEAAKRGTPAPAGKTPPKRTAARSGKPKPAPKRTRRPTKRG